MRPTPNGQVAADLHERLDHYVRRRVSSRADAEDVLQDILLRLLSSDGPRDAGKLLPWAFAVARHRIIDFYRERQRLPAAPGRTFEAGRDGADAFPLDLRGALPALMARLSEADQDALRAVDLDGMSQKKYAGSRGLNYVTAKSRVQRARRRLRREFDRCCEIIRDRRGSPIECSPREQSDSCGTACDGRRAG